jgi:hypothetical protein
MTPPRITALRFATQRGSTQLNATQRSSIMKKHPWLRQRWNIDDARKGLIPVRKIGREITPREEAEMKKIAAQRGGFGLVANGIYQTNPTKNTGFKKFLDQYKDDDELWTYSNGEKYWKHLCGRMGLAIVRHHKPIAWHETCMN